MAITVQVRSSITNAIKDKIYAAEESSQADIVITEIGGTIGASHYHLLKQSDR